MSNWKDKLDKISVGDPNSKGCTICLGELLCNDDNIKPIIDFIETQIKEAERRALESINPMIRYDCGCLDKLDEKLKELNQ